MPWDGRITLCHGLPYFFGDIVSRFLKLLDALAQTLGQFGSFLAPNKIKTIARIKMISPPPRLNRANIGFIYSLVRFNDWYVLTRHHFVALSLSKFGDRRSATGHPRH